MEDRDYGLAFPLKVDALGVNIHPTLQESLDGSLSTILSWHLNARNFLNTFGAILYLSLGKPNTPGLQGAIRLYVTKAVRNWEPRLTNVRTEIEATADTMKLTVTGNIVGQQDLYNYSAIL